MRNAMRHWPTGASWRAIWKSWSRAFRNSSAAPAMARTTKTRTSCLRVTATRSARRRCRSGCRRSPRLWARGWIARAMSKVRNKALRRHAVSRDAGFTLLEILVVIAILGLLIGMVAPAALRQLGSAKASVGHQSIERLTGILDIYKLD